MYEFGPRRSKDTVTLLMPTSTGVNGWKMPGTWYTGGGLPPFSVVVVPATVVVVGAAPALGPAIRGATGCAPLMRPAEMAAWRASAPPTTMTDERNAGVVWIGTNDWYVAAATDSSA